MNRKRALMSAGIGGAVLLLTTLTLTGCATHTGAGQVQPGQPITLGDHPIDATNKARLLEPSTAHWSYEVAPTPAPERTPRVRLNEVAFDQGSTTLPREAKGVVIETAKRMRNETGLRLFLIGFADREEAASLALDRANAIRDALVRQGVERTRLETSSFGNMFSKADDTQPIQMKLERRVEMWVVNE